MCGGGSGGDTIKVRKATRAESRKYHKNKVMNNSMFDGGSGSSSSSGSCSHSWKFDHKGGDKTYPRYWYKCKQCGKSGVAENSGDTIREQ